MPININLSPRISFFLSTSSLHFPMSGTMSSASSDWIQFYQPSNLSDQPPSTVVARGWTGEITTDATANITSSLTKSSQLGRVNRTNTRRRSRASRKTPTTLVNTDTTNFRAMVQQFTGGGGGGDQTTPPFIPGNGSSNQYLGNYNSNNSANLSFGLGPTGSVMAASPAGGYNLQFRQPLDGGGSGVGGQQYYQGEQHQAFLQSLQNYTSSGPTVEDVDPTQGRGSSSSANIETGEVDNSYVF